MNEKNQAAQYTWSSEPLPEETNPVMLRRRIKSGYGWAGSMVLWQYGATIVLTVIATFVLSLVLSPRIIASNPGISSEEVAAIVTETLTSDGKMVIFNAFVAILADAIAIIAVAKGAAGRFKLKSVLRRPEISAGDMLLAAAGIIGLQGFSVIFQNIIMSVLGYTGVSDGTQASFTFNGGASDIYLLMYGVVIGPVLEELMMRGLVLNLLAPADKRFAVVASSLLFGLMHGNFNQIFNGFLLGLLLGYIAVKGGSVMASVICHIAANANIFLLSYICEFRLAESAGREKAVQCEFIVIAAELVIGIAALIFLLRRQGRVTGSGSIDGGYIYADDGASKLTWPALIRTVTFWCTLIICVAFACKNVQAL